MRFKLLSIGRVSPILKLIQDYYQRRIPSIEILELRKRRKVKDEAEEIIPRLAGFIVVLDERGKELSSIEFARLIANKSRITFVVGSANGLDKSVVDKANFKLSLSRLTLQHDIARIVLLEQIYRAVQILKGSPYHRT